MYLILDNVVVGLTAVTVGLYIANIDYMSSGVSSELE